MIMIEKQYEIKNKNKKRRLKKKSNNHPEFDELYVNIQ